MTRNTEALIRRLAEEIEPVRPLRRPWVRTAVWLAVAIPYVGLIVVVMSPRPDLSSKVTDPRFIVEQVAALATGIAAAAAAFATVVPGHNREYLLLPVLPLAVWLGSLGRSCIQDWIALGPHGVFLRPEWMCFPMILFVGAVPALAMALMLRRGAPLTPFVTTGFGGLAAAGLGDFGLRLVHLQDAGTMVLIWQLGSVFALAVLSGWAGRFLLNWRSIPGSDDRAAAS